MNAIDISTINTIETRAEVVRARHALYSCFTQQRATAYLSATDKHYKRKAAQIRAVLVILFLAAIISLGLTTYSYITGHGVGMFVMLAPMLSAVCMVIVGSSHRRALTANASDALETVHDAHTLHQARQRNT